MHLALLYYDTKMINLLCEIIGKLDLFFERNDKKIVEKK